MIKKIINELKMHNIIPEIAAADYEKYINNKDNHEFLANRIRHSADDFLSSCQVTYGAGDDSALISYLYSEFYYTALYYSEIAAEHDSKIDFLLRQIDERRDGQIISGYTNTSVLYRACNECMRLLSSELYRNTILMSFGEYESGEQMLSAVLDLKNSDCCETVLIETPVLMTEINRMISGKYKLTLAEIFRREFLREIAAYRHFGINIEEKLRAISDNESREIVNMAFMNFDSLRNSETFRFNILSITQITSDCVRGYLAKL